ncbi:MAG TPA: CHAT domain-containing protein [Longimicrobium sp.]|nr:CHAT domain-containing protein [Longimicrobium sp.]
MALVPPPPPAPPALRVSVVNGNLTFVAQPLLLGHYRAMALTGTERVMDDLVGGAMSVALGLGQYPELPGTHEVFINTRPNPRNPLQPPRPRSVVVVGLGDEGTLRATDLADTVRRGVIAWSNRVAEEPAPAAFELAATLMGSGGTGISAGQSASLVAEGVLAANQRLAAAGRPVAARLLLIELYLDRATEAWRALRAQAEASAGAFALDDEIACGIGALPRPLDGGYRGARYDLITAVTVEGEHGNDAVSYVVNARRARTEVHAHAMQRPLLRELVAHASNDGSQDDGIGRTLFRLLVPVELEPFLAGTDEAVIEVDGGTAGIPWEMLDPGTGGARPWAIDARLLRKLRTADYRLRVVDATTENAVLVIGEPAVDDARYARLPGAREEARAVVKKLAGSAQVVGLVSGDPPESGVGARKVIDTLLQRDWRIVHIAGHGEPPDTADGGSGDPRGVVLSGGIYLGAREIGGMRVVPELVFVNCCHLAARTGDELLRENEPGPGGRYDRARFAAGVAQALIEVGVRCVVAAGWAVNDAAAQVFATTFYDQLVRGERFIDAVARAREATYREKTGGNTWAAYQCYGDPDWTFRRDAAAAAASPDPAPPEAVYAGVASPSALRLALETLAVNGGFDDDERGALPGRLEYLETRFGARWGGMGAVAEAFATAWAEADPGRAAGWYRRALRANDGGASLRTAERLGGLRARLAWEALEAFDPADGGADGQAALEARLDAARREIRAALELLQHLADDVQSSVERESLCGSAWKRLAQVEARAERPEAELAAIAAMRDRYAKAEALARGSGDTERYYPALNRMAAELITQMGNDGWSGFDSADLEDVRACLDARVDADPDFWSVVSQVDLLLYQAVARRDLAGARGSIEREYDDLYRRVGSGLKWASVSDQLKFVLAKYEARAADAERDAIAALWDRLREYAG